MSLTICRCDGLPYNTGLPNTRQKSIDQAVLLVLVNRKTNAGAYNSIPADTLITQAFLDAKTQNADESQRWYPLGFSSIQNVVTERAESATVSYDTGNSAKTTQGVRTFSGMFVKAGTDVQKIIDSFKCQYIGYYAIDKCGVIIGTVATDGSLRPTPIFTGSLDTINEFGGSSDRAGGVMISFEHDQLVKDSDLGYVAESAITGDVLNLEGLIEAVSTVSAEATTGFVVALKSLSGAFDSKVAIEGLVLADFALYNETSASTVTVTSVTEAPAGTYTFVTPAQTSADVLTLTGTATALGKNFFVEETTVTIP
jgi:hypothetical protein